MKIHTTIMLSLAVSLLCFGCQPAGDSSSQPQADSSSQVQDDSSGKSQEESNKETVIAFYNAAINDKDFEAASKYLGDKYIQHNPLAADGPEGLRTFLEFAKANLGTFKVEFKRVLADGDFVFVHSHATAGPDDRGSAVMDIFRLENGKVVEHWDVIQAIPETAMNQNGMF